MDGALVGAGSLWPLDQKNHLLVGKDIVLRFIIEYSSLMDFGP